MTRWLLGGLGVATGLYGAWLLLTLQETDQLASVARWLVAGVLLHDVVLAGLVLLVGFAVTRVVPAAARAPVTVAAVVFAPTTLLAVPVLGRFGAKADNPTLLDRDYAAGWLVLTAVVLVVAAVGGVARARRGRRRTPSSPVA